MAQLSGAWPCLAAAGELGYRQAGGDPLEAGDDRGDQFGRWHQGSGDLLACRLGRQRRQLLVLDSGLGGIDPDVEVEVGVLLDADQESVGITIEQAWTGHSGAGHGLDQFGLTLVRRASASAATMFTRC